MNRSALLLPALLGLILLVPTPQAKSADATPELETLTVQGEQPGPGLWALQHGDHRLWVLATVSPLPKGLTWRSRQLERVMADTQVVIAPPSVDVEVGDIGFLEGLSTIRLALKVGRLPDKQRLVDVMPAPLHARWASLRQRYAPRDDALESRRPFFAGIGLYDKALARAGLDRDRDVWDDVRKLAKRQKVPLREPQIRLPLSDPKGLLGEFINTPVAADLPCFEALLPLMESQLPQLQQRGLAWASGDIDVLKQQAPDDLDAVCLNVFTGTPRLAALYQEGLRRWRLEWVLAAEGALLRNTASLAVLPLEEVTGPQGLVAQMVQRGYTLMEPQH